MWTGHGCGGRFAWFGNGVGAGIRGWYAWGSEYADESV